MAYAPRRADRWSLRQVSLEAGVTLATAKAVVRRGHLDPAALTAADVVVLRVAAMLPALQPLGEMRPANAPRQIPARELDAIAQVRRAGLAIPAITTLVVTEDSVQLAHTLLEVSAATMAPASTGTPYLALPVGQWAREVSTRLEAEAA